MSDNRINIDLSGFFIVLLIILLIILCIGEPDLLDALIHNLMK